MIMRIIQGLIVFVVIGSNIQWHWTPNGFVLVLVGIGAAFVLTVVPVGIYHECRILWAQRRRSTRERPKRRHALQELDEAERHELRPYRREPYRAEPWDRQE